jgi:putative transposase
MARPLRLEYLGAVYHLTARGNARQAIYVDDEDRRLFLQLLGAAVERYQWRCHAYCLMPNHYHLLVETPQGYLSAGMRQLNGVYTQRFNRRHNRVGHVFQGRFKAIVVERDTYLLELCRYIVLNPVRAGLVKRPGNFVWSSYRATAGVVKAPAWLEQKWLLSQFSRQRRRAEAAYRAFVQDNLRGASPWKEVRGQVLLGSETFSEKLAPLFTRQADVQEIPQLQRFAARPSLDQILSGKWTTKAQRNQAIRRAHLRYGYTLAAIGRHLGLHYSTISKTVNAGASL